LRKVFNNKQGKDAMTALQQSTTVSQFQTWVSAPNNVKAPAAKPPVKSDSVAVDTFDRKDLPQTAPLLIPDNKIPKVEEIKKMIQNDGFPFKTDLYKAISRLVQGDMN
jgi:hypothetical protein